MKKFPGNRGLTPVAPVLIKQHHMNKKIKFELGLIIVFLAGLLALGIVWVQGNQTEEEMSDTENDPKVLEDGGNESKQKETKVFNEAEFSFTAPADWAGGKTDEGRLGLVRYEYENSEGKYFRVDVNSPGHGVAPDKKWKFRHVADEIRIIEKGEFCDPEGNPFCSVGNDSLHIWAHEVDKNSKFNFHFGSRVKEENVDLRVFNNIFESMEVKLSQPHIE